MSERRDLWGGRFASGPAEVLRRFNDSWSFDRALLAEDVQGSVAWAEELGRSGVLTAPETRKIVKGLGAVKAAWDVGEGPTPVPRTFTRTWRGLAKRIGPLAGKLHTARSRNDQVATDLRLWLRNAFDAFHEAVVELAEALAERGAAEAATPMPGYTHLKRAEPVTFGHWSLAYAEMVLRDADRIRAARRRANECPLGSGALSGNAAVHRPGAARQEPRLRPGHGELSRRRLRPRRGGRVPLRVAPLRAPLPDGRGPDLLHLGRGGLRRAAGRLSTGSSRMPRRRTPTSSSSCAARRARARRADRLPRAAQRASARVRQGPPARQGAALPDARRPGSGSAGAHRARQGPSAEAGADGGRGRGRRPAPGDGARRRARARGACRSARRTRSSGAASPLRRRRARGSPSFRRARGSRRPTSRRSTSRRRSRAAAPSGQLPPGAWRRRRSESRAKVAVAEGGRGLSRGRQEKAMRLPKGFAGSAVRAGLRKKPGLDVALLVAPDGANAAAVFTKNLFQAAPVTLSRAALKKSRGRVRAVVVNAGCANAVTGAAGDAAAGRVQELAAELAGCPREEVFVASTGVIGVVLPDEKVRAFLPDAFTRLSAGGLEAVSRAILTTDAAPKVAGDLPSRGGKPPGRRLRQGADDPPEHDDARVRTTDAAATPLPRRPRGGRRAFNAISVDGDTSTNDMVCFRLGKAPVQLKTMDEPAVPRRPREGLRRARLEDSEGTARGQARHGDHDRGRRLGAGSEARRARGGDLFAREDGALRRRPELGPDPRGDRPEWGPGLDG
ncbi:MAG: bifunctional ornithine acetyltransferase/N-acetylglutamate synthase, partial [Holophagales bacterium]|nr:bifunctional ornithine acetyltransferase/N-acetylglutamate synthase [Holophagales bacterium]